MAKVIVYSQPTCPPCKAEKAWFDEQGIAYEDRNVHASEDWLRELVALGSQSTPTTVVESEAGRDVVIGFDRTRLKALLAR